jgi:diguanylate cyclase (GGDEF)-like protein/PAS domain S-box-containing protein
VSNAIKLLLVEDSDDDARLVVRLLQRGGFEVQFVRVDTARGFEEALARQGWDAVVADYLMPRFTGLEALKIVRAGGFDMPFILISGTVGEEIAVEAMKAGANDFIIKTNLSRLASVLVRELRESANRSEHRHAQDRLRKSESRYRRLFESAQDGILLLNADTGQIEDVNPFLIEMLGYSHAEFLGKKLWEMGTFADVPQSKEMFLQLQQQGYVRYEDLPLRTKAGATVSVEFVSNSYDCQGVKVIQCNVRDISERKRSEGALRRFRTAMDSSGDAIVLIDRASMRYIDVNQTLCDLIGYTREELIGMTPMDLFSADRETLERDYDAIIADNSSSATKVEGQYRHKDGSLIPIESRRRALRIDNGWIIVGTARDITARKRSEELMLRERNFTNAVLDSLPGLFYLIDEQGRFLRWNRNFEVVSGYSSEEIAGLSPIALFAGTDKEKVAEAIQQVFRAGETTIEAEVVAKDLTKTAHFLTGKLVHIDQKPCLSGMGIDVTLRVQAERGIKRLNRVYAMLSGINSLIVRVHDRDELSEEACQIAVEHGKFKMAWIGVVDRNAMKVVPIASAGAEPEFLALVKDQFSLREDAPLGNTKTARAVREKKAIVVNEIQDGSAIFFAKKCLDRGISSMAILPLLVSDEAVGVLALYADASGFFDEEEMKLLTELAGDIAFAIENIEKQKRLDYLAYYDSLTGLANRTLFLERVTQYMRAAVSGGHKLALFFLDLERFRNINDSLGRPAGDALLRQVSEWLAQSVGDASLLARVGADHFVIVLPEVKQTGDAAHLLDKKIQEFLDHPFRLDDMELRLNVKVGVALFPNDGTDAETLLKNSEAALKKAKKRGERYVFYRQKMTERVSGNLTLENQLRAALDNGEFVLHYQPKVNLESGQLTGAESLIRWNDPRTGLVPPGRFIPILEETGLIYDVGRWALHQAIEDYLRWRAAGLDAVRIAVNVSPLQLRNRGFIAEVRQAIGVDARAPAGLELEITESLIMEDVKHSIVTLQAVRAMGVTIAIDDFGTGFSSLSYLAKLPVDTLKIDRSFVIDMTGGPQGLALVSTIISLAKSLKLKVVAEGVETEEQSRLLRLLRCDEMQGFLFSKPVPAQIFEAKFLASLRQLDAAET